MKVFHAPDYIEFLQRVSPANQRDLTADLSKCKPSLSPSLLLTNHTDTDRS